MTNGWPVLIIRDFASVFDGPHATPKSSKTAISGAVFLGISSLQSGRLDLSQSGFLSEEDYLRWTRRVAPRPGDVVFSYETRLGEAALIPKGLRCSLGRRLALMRPDTTKVDPRFLLYSFLGPEFQETIRKNTVHGSTVNRIMLTDFPSFGMAIPPIDEQRAIAATLGALDDKIESNRRTSALISGLVSAEFQAGLATASGSEIALGAVISCTKGVSYKSVDLQESRTSLVTLKSFDRKGGYKRDGLKQYVGPYRSEHVIAPGELAVAQTDLTQGAEVVGRVIRVPADQSADALVASLALVIVRPKSEDLQPEYLYGVLADESFRQFCRSRTSGTTVLHLAGDAIPSYPAPWVEPEAQIRYAERVRPLILRKDALEQENLTLTAVRDTLLPELLSSRIRVQHASAAVPVFVHELENV